MSLLKIAQQKIGKRFLPAEAAPPEEERPGYRAANLQGLGARTGQEDSFTVAGAFDAAIVQEKGLFFAVCDGMGGMKDGRLASETAIQSLRQSFQAMDRSQDLAPQLERSVFQASAQVEALIGGDGGSTVVTGILYQDRLYYASVGDSFLYLLRGGSLLRLNAEQNLLHQKYLESIRAGNMDPLPLQGLPNGAALTGFLGMPGLDEVDCSVLPLPIDGGDVLLACSDGVGGVLSPEEVAKALQMPTPEEMCASLDAMIASYNRPHQDNYTAIVIQCVSQS
ncbi:MAG: SpoIIE family protein phosphatase [Lawsonibacter sp.]|jgi:serine/threonine protein phosphatase PrpC|nr:SpoIIE family protein phosphatase [Lawsonibacter sp.]